MVEEEESNDDDNAENPGIPVVDHEVGNEFVHWTAVAEVGEYLI